MSHPLSVSLHTSGRAKSYSRMYFDMCAKALVEYRICAAKLNKLHELDLDFNKVTEQVEEASVLPVIFAGMSLESTLYDLSACLFGEEFVANTDKLDPLGKFFNLVMLVDRRAPITSSITYQSIQALVTARNKLVHHKSQTMQDENLLKLLAKAEKEHKKHLQGIESSFRALVLLSLYFDGNIFEELRIIPSFKKPEYWHSIVPKELHRDVEWCIEVSRKERIQTAEQLPIAL